jgi:hypothetical protein
LENQEQQAGAIQYRTRSGSVENKRNLTLVAGRLKGKQFMLGNANKPIGTIA